LLDNLLSSSRLLKLSLPLVKTHGFTRETLSRSVLSLPASEQHTQPLSDSAITALFGRGDLARRTLIDAWLEDGLTHMSSESTGASGSVEAAGGVTMRDVLRTRLQYNEPVLAHLPDVSYRPFYDTRLTNYEQAFGLMASSGFHVVDPLPVLEHAAKIADRACYTTRDRSLQVRAIKMHHVAEFMSHYS